MKGQTMRKSFLILFLVFIACSTIAQNMIVTGIVKEKSSGEALPGVAIYVLEERKGTTTDFDGNFSIEIKSKEASLEFSFIGMKKKTVKVNGASKLQIELESENKILDEMVVVGYGGVQSRESVVGSVEQIGAKELERDQVTTSFDKMLEGMVAGVQVEKQSGDLLSPVKIRIRGQGSLAQVLSSDIVASSEPLYVLDGVPLKDSPEPSHANVFADNSINPLSLINPNDIESITVLKDASASAIYGANASNGVILITTKKGTIGKTMITASHNYSTGYAINMVKYLDTPQFVELFTETYLNSGYTSEEVAKMVGRTDINNDWQKLILRPSQSMQSNVSISGGSNRTSYRLSLSYGDMKTISKGNDMKRFTSRMRVNSDLFEKLNLDMTMGFSFVNNNIFAAFSSSTFHPNIPIYNEDGSFNNNPPFTNLMNPLAGLAQNEDWMKTYNTNGAIRLKYQLFPFFSVSAHLGIDFKEKMHFVFASKENGLGYTKGGLLSELRGTAFKWNNYYQADYNQTFNKNHNVQALFGFQIDNDEETQIKATDTKLLYEGIKRLGLVSRENSTSVSKYDDNGTVSWYSRISYSYHNKYNASANFRRDASSIFGGDVQAENFASFGASWLINKEYWLEDADFLDMLKLRLSYGKVGNSRLGSYAAKGLYTVVTSTLYNGDVSARPLTAPNEHLTWEKKHKLNIAVDATFLQRFSTTLEVYQDRIVDAITSMNVPYESGFSSISVNNTTMRNTGLEFSVNAKIIDSAFKWNLTLNASKNKNVITKLANNLDKFSESSYYSAGLFVGKDVSSIYAWRWAGVNPDNGDSQWYLKDGSITDDRKIAEELENRVIVGKSSPDVYGGIGNVFSWKNFELSFKMSYSIGGSKMLSYKSTYTNSDGNQIHIHNQSINQLERWQKPGDITDVPQLRVTNMPIKQSTRMFYDFTHINFSDLVLSYNLDKIVANRLNIKKARMYFQINNLGYWYKGDQGKEGNGMAEYRFDFPESRTFTIGVDLTI